METKIASFNVDHVGMQPGVYVVHGTAAPDLVDTYDLRFTSPNTMVISPSAMHSLEHLGASYFKLNSVIKNSVVSFCPGACNTMFYLEVRTGTSENSIMNALVDFLWFVHDATEVPGVSLKECGNYKQHSLEEAKFWAQWFYDRLKEDDFSIH